MSTYLLVDGNAIMHRAYHAIPNFLTKDGIPTNILYGFFSILNKAIVSFKPTHIIVCFDTPAQTFRNKAYKEYQIHRPTINDDFKIQIPYVKEALDKGAIIHLEKDGYEADDIIGTVAIRCSRPDNKVLILTGDKDIMQLVNKKVYVVSPQQGISNFKIYDPSEVKTKLGIFPEKIPDYKGLMGDPSDNYKGAKGIGPKTAIKLLAEFQSIDNIYNNIDKINNPKIIQLLKQYKDNVLLSKQLATIVTNVDIDCDLKKTVFNGFKSDLREYFLNFGIKSLAQRLFEKKPEKLKKEKQKTKDNKNQLGLF